LTATVSKSLAKQLAVDKLTDLGLEVNIVDVILIDLSSGIKQRIPLATATADLFLYR
jgi:ABC-type transporter Mla maintaining outer membrane lipid asymmetry ATPase subunit MlaF